MLSYHSRLRKTIGWYILEIFIANAFHIYTKDALALDISGKKDFKESVIKNLTSPAKQSNRLKPEVFSHYLPRYHPKRKRKIPLGDANISTSISKDMIQDINVSNALTEQLYASTHVSIK